MKKGLAFRALEAMENVEQDIRKSISNEARHGIDFHFRSTLQEKRGGVV